MSDLLSHLNSVTRRGMGIGGSDIAAIVGLSPWATPLDTYISITEGRSNNPPNERQKWGRRLEKIIAEAWAEDRNIPIEWVDRTYSSPLRPWQLITPDFVMESQGLRIGGDSKNIGSDRAWTFGDPGTDEVPDEYKCQMYWYLDVTGFDVWKIVPLFGGNKLADYTIHPNEEIQGMLREAGDKFLKDHVIPGNPPLPGGSSSTDAWIKRKFSSDALPPRTATSLEMNLVRQYEESHQECADAEKRKNSIKQQLQMAIGECEGLILPGGRGRVTWKYTERAGYTVSPCKYRNFRLAKRKADLN